MNLETVNKSLKDKSPTEIVQWALSVAERPIVTTNFRPMAATILHVVVAEAPKIPVIWCDTGYNTRRTYEHALRLIDQMKLNMDVFVPMQTSAFRDVTLGIPSPDTPEHDEFTRQVKLEPFQRAMDKYQPDVWFTNLRKDQTEFRANLDIVSYGKNGELKVCPFFYWTDQELNDYLESHGLESEENYYDPTKVLAKRECGLHV